MDERVEQFRSRTTLLGLPAVETGPGTVYPFYARDDAGQLWSLMAGDLGWYRIRVHEDEAIKQIAAAFADYNDRLFAKWLTDLLPKNPDSE